MTGAGFTPSALQQALLERVVSACTSDDRVVAAFLGGSFASGAADASSDLDFGLIVSDAAFDEFVATKGEFVRQLGVPDFLEDFGSARYVFAIFADGVEADFSLGREGDFAHMHVGPFRTLIDRTGVLSEAVFAPRSPDLAEQTEALRRLIAWFWHDFSHLAKALERGQLWWAQGQIEVLRAMCVSLARLDNDFADVGIGSEPYFKVERLLPGERLAPLATSVGSFEREAMVHSAKVITSFYTDLAPRLARRHGLPYPAGLESSLVHRLDALLQGLGGRSGG